MYDLCFSFQLFIISQSDERTCRLFFINLQFFRLVRSKVCPKFLLEHYEEFNPECLDELHHFTFIWDQNWDISPPMNPLAFLQYEFKNPTKAMKRTLNFVARQRNLLKHNVKREALFWQSFLETSRLNIFSNDYYADFSNLLYLCELTPILLSNKLLMNTT